MQKLRLTRFAVTLAAVLLAAASSAQAQVHGVNVQVNEGGPVPTVAQLQAVLNPGDFVRDVLGWARVDRNCDLRGDPSRTIAIPDSMATLYERVRAAGGKNFVTLGFNNVNCGQISNSGADTFPNSDELRAEFAAYAVAVVKQVPALGGISIWNELNGTWNGGYTTAADRLTNYCLLANKVVTEVRKVAKDVPIAIGATVGVYIGKFVIRMFDVYGCLGKGDPTIWIDVHPYVNKNFERWELAISKIRADQITNPLIATEWGAGAAYKWSLANPGGNYIAALDGRVLSAHSPWAGSMWFELLYEKNFPHSSLFDVTGSVPTVFGSQYIAAFKR